ncbi:sterol desaturase/sphingolipid hydroxylase (fatty acid hydroxylase superfamily) [Inhella inkyongensis]|uniref:Sterol desaturase/sphingolipid hydroxylase (Fatty acid hydroxylase superfamily) n=1 Tax=Inhella inkyongensis TaxID=392593 RepID=A0A840SAP7_9BURK|nr:sterol desaturase/sphingolipid hydroxylase (fatty acid hydroxylase superfamily) [Inhella inkyongensis]
MAFTPAQIIVLATPVFLGLIALEAWVAWRRQRHLYDWSDAMSSIGLGMLSQVVGLFTRFFNIGIYAWVADRWALGSWDAGSPWVWLLGLIAYDFCYYWLHRAGHRVALLWAAHGVHHQSEHYNLSTALRQTGSNFLLGWLFYLPLAVAGLPVEVFAGVALIDLLYQFWVHTEQIGKLGWFDRWFCSPSNHRVHHAVNPRYLDKNYGGILVVWDRLFGSFQEEDEPCVYGTVKPLRSWDPLWANVVGYGECLRSLRRIGLWRALLAPPGWEPGGGLPQVDLSRPRFAPLLSTSRQLAAGTLFFLALFATLGLLWWAGAMPFAMLSGAGAGVVGLLWLSGRLAQ